MYKFIVLAIASVFMTGCSSMQVMDQGRSMMGETVYTQTNLHPDEENARLYAVNYQLDAVMPVCTQVRMDAVSDKLLEFTRMDTGRQYQYRNHKAAAEAFPQHLARFFGFSCPRDAISRLSPLDQRGIRLGKAQPGMSKRAVLFALGHPPRHVNPDPMNADSWTYWSNRFNRFLVHFDSQGKVSRIEE